MIATGRTDGASPVPAAIVAEVDDALRHALERDPRFTVSASDARDGDAIVEAAAGAQVLVTRHHNRLSAEVLDRLPHVRVIAQGTSGIDNIDVEKATQRGIRIVSTPGANANAVAEYVFAQLLAISRTMPLYDTMVREGRWSRRDCASRHELAHYRLGIVGVGNVGSRVAQLARLFGMTAGGFDPYIDGAVFDRLGITRFASLDELLTASSAITLHVPFSSETLRMIGHAQLQRLTSGAIVINASRGEVLELDPLIDAINEGRVAGAACDVFDPEPARFDRPLPPQLLVTPHIAGCTAEAKRNAGLRLYALICEALGITSE